MISFYLRGGYSILQTAAKTSLIDTARAMSALGLVFGSSYIYNKATSLAQHSFFKNRYNNHSNVINDVYDNSLYNKKASPSDH